MLHKKNFKHYHSFHQKGKNELSCHERHPILNLKSIYYSYDNFN